MYLPVTNSFELSYFVYFHICILPCCIVLSIAKMWSLMYPANSNKHLSWLNRSTPIFASVDHHECSQPAAWTTNRSLLVSSSVRPFQEDRPTPVRPYPELRTWMVVRSGVISVFPTHSGNVPASPDIRPTTWLRPACIPNTTSIPALNQPTIAMTTTHIHQLWLSRPPSTRSTSASGDHPQAPVVTQQQQDEVFRGFCRRTP